MRVCRIADGAVGLTAVDGAEVEVLLPELLSDASFTIEASASRARVPVPPRGLLESLPSGWLHLHRSGRSTSPRCCVVCPPTHPAAAPRPEYDPARSRLRQRQLAKVEELAAAGTTVSLSRFGRMCRAYQREGLIGLVDGRKRRRSDGGVDPRVESAVRQAIAEETDRSTGTVARLRRQVEQILTEHDDVAPVEVMPSRATFYRLVERLSGGRHDRFGADAPVVGAAA